MGLDSWPNYKANDDVNEYGDSTASQMRTIDAFNFNDPALLQAISGGVTTILVLPGSGNMMGGEAFAFKLRPMENGRVEDMLLNARILADQGPYKNRKLYRWMKMACGENPKRLNKKPTTRMGEIYLMREKLARAKTLLQRQDDWCSASSKQGEFPTDIQLESLVDLLRHNALLNVHCYEVIICVDEGT